MKVSVYEFSDHVRVAIQQVYLMGMLEPAPECTLFLRQDCRLWVSSTFAGKVRYRNKYFMAAQFFCEAAILRRKVLVTTGPEASSRFTKFLFMCLLRLLRNRISLFMVVRDLKNDRGKYLLKNEFYSKRSVLAVESDALLRSTREAGYSPGGYLYPTSITYSDIPDYAGQPSDKGNTSTLRILITGSLDAARRNYEMFFESLAILRRNGVRVQVVVGGHCMTNSAAWILKNLETCCDSVVARDLLSDEELDFALIVADAIVCLNRPEYYAGVKGSGAIGDAFFAGKRLLMHVDLATPGSADSRFYTSFTTAENLSDHLLKAHADDGYLRIEQDALARQTAYFSKLINNWLML